MSPIASFYRALACFAFIWSGLMVCRLILFIYLHNAFEISLETELASSGYTATPFPLDGYIQFGAIIPVLITVGIALWQYTNHTERVAKAKGIIAHELSALEESGWQIEHNTPPGNIDIFCVSPNNNTYVIDIQTYKGAIVADQKKLYRRIGKTKYPFKQGYLPQAAKQSLKFMQTMGINPVTPIVTFPNARVAIPGTPINHVYVTDRAQLISLLKTLG
ncbi:MAG: nuclease-related domain-containing protein [Leptolyngbyaceae cyanobacterium]